LIGGSATSKGRDHNPERSSRRPSVLDLELTDRVVVVTGGASNIGRGIVHAFAQQGANVLIVDFDEQRGSDTNEALAWALRTAG
jgi:FlaA1/EpsC-like NDP-sugar epimerase